MLEKQARKTLSYLSGVPKAKILFASILLLMLLTVADYMTGLHYGFSLLYLFSVLLLTWFVNLTAGITFSFLSIISWFSVRLVLMSAEGVTGTDYMILSGEAAIRLLFLIATSYILSLLKKDFEIRAKQNEQLVELGNLKNYFVGIVAHDLRNPVSIIELSSSVLLDNSKNQLTPDQLSLLEMIYKKSLYMMKLIEDYLDITKIEAGYLELNKSFTDYTALIEEIVEINEIIAGKKEIHIQIHKEADIPMFSFDRTKLSQVINNLLLNALHYSGPGATVSVTLKVDGKNALTEIADSGPGIAAEDMSRLFQIYYRSKKRTERGTGLGLAISKKIVESHNGTIGFRNNADRGSTFWFSIPMEP